jgi:hypothetical protein
MTTLTPPTLATRSSPRALATVLLSGGVAAAMMLTEYWLEPWADQHQIGAWLALWVVGVVALLALRGLTRRAAQAILRTLDSWSAQAARRRADERLWALARTDARLMAELQASMKGADARKAPEDLFSQGQRRTVRIVRKQLHSL